LGKLAAYFNI